MAIWCCLLSLAITAARAVVVEVTFNNHPILVMNVCSVEPHQLVGTDGSWMVRRNEEDAFLAGAVQFCRFHKYDEAACNAAREQVRGEGGGG